MTKSLPPAVQAQADMLDKFYANSAEQPAEPTTPEGEVTPETSNAQEPAAPAAQEPAASPNVEPQPAHEAQPRRVEPDSEETWEQRYRTLQGIHKRDKGALQNQVAELTRKVQSLSDQLERAQTPPEPADHTKYNADYGEDMVKMVRDVAASESAEARKRAEQAERLAQEAREATQAAAQREFFARLTAKVPDWEPLNTNENFLLWLDESDLMLGTTRYQALNDAVAAGDVDRTALFFEAFKNGQAPKAAQQAPAPRLEKQQAPNTSARSAPRPTGNPQDHEVLTEAFIADHFNKVVKGKYASQAEADQVQRRIDKAMTEGRIRAAKPSISM